MIIIIGGAAIVLIVLPPLALFVATKVLGWRFDKLIQKGDTLLDPHHEHPDRIIGVMVHSSTFDFVVMQLFALANAGSPWQCLAVGKKEINNFVVRAITGAFGTQGVYIDRSKRGATEQIVQALKTSAPPRYLLGIFPEGTRGLIAPDKWRSGFFHIAKGANAKIVIVGLDYGARRVALGKTFDPIAFKDEHEALQAIKEELVRYTPQNPAECDLFRKEL